MKDKGYKNADTKFRDESTKLGIQYSDTKTEKSTETEITEASAYTQECSNSTNTVTVRIQ